MEEYTICKWIKQYYECYILAIKDYLENVNTSRFNITSLANTENCNFVRSINLKGNKIASLSNIKNYKYRSSLYLDKV